MKGKQCFEGRQWIISTSCWASPNAQASPNKVCFRLSSIFIFETINYYGIQYKNSQLVYVSRDFLRCSILQTLSSNIMLINFSIWVNIRKCTDSGYYFIEKVHILLIILIIQLHLNSFMLIKFGNSNSNYVKINIIFK